MRVAFASVYTKTQYDCEQAHVIRLNQTSTRLMRGANFCRVHRTGGHKHIVIEPLHGLCAEDEPRKTPVRYYGGAALVNVTRLVTGGEINKSIFAKGGRYKVKRSGDGKIVVCLQEEILKRGKDENGLGGV